MNINENDGPEKYLPEKENYFPHDFFSLLKEERNNELTKLSPNDSINYKNYFFEQNSLGNTEINSFLPLIPFEFQNSIQGKTETNTNDFIKRKRKSDEYSKEKNLNIEKKEENKEKKIVKNNISNKKRGARPKKETYNAKIGHNKWTDDNIIRKIKTAIFSYIRELLNKSLKYTNGEFLPLNTKLHKNLKRDENLKLFDKTIYNIYMNEDLNKAHINANNSNKNLIKKILEENLEIETIKILKMKFIDVLKYIREKDLEKFLNKIKEKEEKKEGEKREEVIPEEESIEHFMELVKHYLNEYVNWFTFKNGRNTNKSKKI